LVLWAGRAVGSPLQNLEWGWGFQAGAGTSGFSAKAHPPQSSSTNLFAQLGGQIPSRQEQGFSGRAGLHGGLLWRGLLGLRLELGWEQASAKTVDDLGSGTERATEFTRQSAEGALLLDLGWPFSFGRWTLRPYLGGGALGNRTLSAKRGIGIVGSGSKDFEWDGLPNEDYAWLGLAGLEWRLKAKDGRRHFGDRVALEFRLEEGQKELDPKGGNEVKSRKAGALLSISY
jgi:hypothetical protein